MAITQAMCTSFKKELMEAKHNFLNSGGVTSKTKCIPMNKFFLNILNFVDEILVKLFPSIFCMGRRIVLKKIN